MNLSLPSPLYRLGAQRVFIFGAIITAALIAFEIFNFSTTMFAFSDLLGDLRFLGIPWSTILAFAFCGIDFAGVARLFTPGVKSEDNHAAWYLFGAWFLGASMNAMLTWWGVSLAILNHETLGNDVVDRSTLLTIVPVFVAALVLMIRVLIIGTFSVSGNRMFTFTSSGQRMASPNHAGVPANAAVQPNAAANPAAAPRRPNGSNGTGNNPAPPAPKYNPLAMRANSPQPNNPLHRM